MHEDHFYGHINTDHNGHYWKMAILAIIALPDMALNMVVMGVFSKKR